MTGNHALADIFPGLNELDHRQSAGCRTSAAGHFAESVRISETKDRRDPEMRTSMDFVR